MLLKEVCNACELAQADPFCFVLNSRPFTNMTQSPRQGMHKAVSDCASHAVPSANTDYLSCPLSCPADRQRRAGGAHRLDIQPSDDRAILKRDLGAVRRVTAGGTEGREKVLQLCDSSSSKEVSFRRCFTHLWVLSCVSLCGQLLLSQA